MREMTEIVEMVLTPQIGVVVAMLIKALSMQPIKVAAILVTSAVMAVTILLLMAMH